MFPVQQAGCCWVILSSSCSHVSQPYKHPVLPSKILCEPESSSFLSPLPPALETLASQRQACAFHPTALSWFLPLLLLPREEGEKHKALFGHLLSILFLTFQIPLHPFTRYLDIMSGRRPIPPPEEDSAGSFPVFQESYISILNSFYSVVCSRLYFYRS